MDGKPVSKRQSLPPSGARSSSPHTQGTADTNLRICVSCRTSRPRNQLLRLTVVAATGEVKLHELNDRHLHGRSAYICTAKDCVERLLKGTKLKHALEGRKKNSSQSRKIQWPLESQLIHTLRTKCTESLESCQNTSMEEKTE